jgi:hypothetical protein
MPTVVEYASVLQQLQARGMRCLYHNSGAFGFPPSAITFHRGWIGPHDGSIRDSAVAFLRQANEPFAEHLTSLLIQTRRQMLPGPVWAMPKSHWTYELDYGSSKWMPTLLGEIGVDASALAGLNNAAAIEFSDHEDALLEQFSNRLLSNLKGSDFCLVFPDRATICTVHSHVQLWWTTADPAVIAGLDRLLPVSPNG